MGRAGLVPAGDEGEGEAGLHSQVSSWLLRSHHGWQAFLVGFLRLLSAGEGRLEAGKRHGLGNSWRQTAGGTGLEIRPRSQTALGDSHLCCFRAE